MLVLLERERENKFNRHCRKLYERIDILTERALDNSVLEIYYHCIDFC